MNYNELVEQFEIVKKIVTNQCDIDEIVAKKLEDADAIITSQQERIADLEIKVDRLMNPMKYL